VTPAKFFLHPSAPVASRNIYLLLRYKNDVSQNSQHFLELVAQNILANIILSTVQFLHFDESWGGGGRGGG